MKELEIEASFGNKIKHVKISQPHGTATYGLQIMIDNGYCGTIVKRNGEWIAYFNDKSLSQFTIDDIRILGELIDNSRVFEI